MPTLPTDREADLLIATYERAELALRALIRQATFRGATGTARYFERQRRAAAAVVEDLRRSTPALTEAAVRASYDRASEATSAVEGVEHGFSGVDRDAVRAATLALHGRLDDAARTVGREADDVLRRVTLGEVAGGLARGDSQRAVTARVRDELLQQGLTGFVDKGGRRWSLETYARMAVRTGTREAVTAGVVNRMRELGDDLIQISDHRTETELCEHFEGNTYSLSGESESYPQVTALPPFHPNCQHVATPAAASFEEFERELGLAG